MSNGFGAGIEKIKIPLLPNEVTAESIIPYLPKVLSTFLCNKRKIQDLWAKFENQHNIMSKVRRYEDDSDINNIVSTPYLYEMVTFKSGYAFGNPKEYAQSSQEQSEGIKYLNRYTRDSNERGIDKNVATYCYATGTSYYFVEPKATEFDSEYEAPYVIYDKMPDCCAKVYSSYNGEPELFDILVTTVTKIEKGKSTDITTISVYMPNVYCEFEYNGTLDFPYNIQEVKEKRKTRAVYKMLPLVEKFANENRIGIVEVGMSLQDAIDQLNSNQVDNVQDLVNQLMVFMNTVLGDSQTAEAEFLKNAKKNGVIVLNDKNPDLKADVKTITQKLDYAGISNIIQSMKRDLFDSCGVPIPSSEASSGGSNTGAVEKGNGYDNAYNRILDDYNSFEKADREVLKRKLFICKNFPNSKVNDIYASDIDIKYNPNMSDNMLTKSQSYVNFVEHGVPPVLAIQWCRISNDAITPAKQIAEYAEAQAKQAQEQTLSLEADNSNGINTSNGENING